MSTIAFLAAAVVAGGVNITTATTAIRTANTGLASGSPAALEVENGTVGSGIDLFVNHIGGQGAVYLFRAEGSTPVPGVVRPLSEFVWGAYDSAGHPQDYAVINAIASDNTAGSGRGYIGFAVQDPTSGSKEPVPTVSITPKSVNLINGAVLQATQIVATTVTTAPTTVNALLKISPKPGMRAFVTDSTNGAFGAPMGTIGGGPYAEPVYYYGGKWRVG